MADDGSAGQGGYAEAGGPADRIRVTLRIAGDALDPDRITDLLEHAPTSAWRKGEDRPGSGVAAVTGMWRLEWRDVAGHELDAALHALLDELPGDPELWRRLHDEWSVDLFCGVFLAGWNRGFALGPLTLRRLADRGLRMDFDVYCDRPEDG